LKGEVFDFGFKKRQVSRMIFFAELGDLIDIQALAGGNKPSHYIKKQVEGKRCKV